MAIVVAAEPPPWTTDTDGCNTASEKVPGTETTSFTVTRATATFPSTAADMEAEPGATAVAIPSKLTDTMAAFEVTQEAGRPATTLPDTSRAVVLNTTLAPGSSAVSDGVICTVAT